MKKFVFTEARILALRKQEVNLAEVGVAHASERVLQAQRIVDADQVALDELSSSLMVSGRNGLTVIDQIAMGMRARLETSRRRLADCEQLLARSLDVLRRAKIAKESLATLEGARRSDHQRLAQKQVQVELDAYNARQWLREDRNV